MKIHELILKCIRLLVRMAFDYCMAVNSIRIVICVTYNNAIDPGNLLEIMEDN